MKQFFATRRFNSIPFFFLISSFDWADKKSFCLEQIKYIHVLPVYFCVWQRAMRERRGGKRTCCSLWARRMWQMGQRAGTGWKCPSSLDWNTTLWLRLRWTLLLINKYRMKNDRFKCNEQGVSLGFGVWGVGTSFSGGGVWGEPFLWTSAFFRN